MNLASTRRNWPTRPRLRALVRLPRAPRRASGIPISSTTTTSSTSRDRRRRATTSAIDITDKALEFIRDSKAIAPEKPFFLYYAPGACHAPHHAPKEWIDKFEGRFDMGYEAMRERDARPAEGARHRPEGHRAAAAEPDRDAGTRTGPDGKPFPTLDVTRPWNSLSDDEKKLFCRMAEVYAGFLAHADDQIGRLLDFLEESGWRENTLVILVSDNGASGEGGPNGSVNEMKMMQGIPDTVEANLPLLDDLGSPKTYNHYPNGWAMAFNTPFKMWKRYEFNGGTATRASSRGPPGSSRGARSGTSTTTPSTSCRRCSTCSASSRPARSTATSRRRSTASACAPASNDPRRRDARDAVLRDARLPGDLARGLEGRHEPSDDRRLGQLQRRRMGTVPHRRRPARSCTTSRRRTGTRSASSRTSGSRRRARTGPSRSTTAGRWRSS